VTYRDRRDATRSRMRDQRVGLAAVAYGPNLHHLSGFDPHPTERPCLLLLSQKGEVLVVPRLHAEDVDGLDVDRIVIYTDAEGPAFAIHGAIAGLGLAGDGTSAPRNCRIDESMRADFLLLLESALPQWEFSGAATLLDPMRLVKSREELEALATVATLTDRALEAVWPRIHEGMTELDASEIVRKAFHDAGADATAFCIVGFGPNSAAAHHRPERRALNQGDAILIDIGARKNHYHSDITRVGFLGAPSAEYLHVYDTVRRALDAAIAAVKPGVQASSVDKAARDVIESAGFGSTFRHGVGHGIGLSVHEPPYLTASSAMTLQEDMTFTLEPGIYFVGRFGIRLEQVVAVTSNGASVLSGASLETVRLPT